MKQLNLTPALYEYMQDIALHEHPVLTELRHATLGMKLAAMQISPEQAQFMQMLVRLLKAKRVLELGTFAGYSALAMALALPADGQLITCDINHEWTENARAYWEKAAVSDKIDLRMAPALVSMQQLLADGLAGAFDLIFIDADKTNYLNYYELALELISKHGLIAIDNILWEGKVIDPSIENAQTREIRKLNNALKYDNRVFTSLLPIGDGLFLIQRRE